MVGNMICRENGDGVRFGHSSATYGGDENAPSAKGGGTLLPLVLARVKMTAPLKTASYINVTGTVWFHPSSLSLLPPAHAPFLRWRVHPPPFQGSAPFRSGGSFGQAPRVHTALQCAAVPASKAHIWCTFF